MARIVPLCVIINMTESSNSIITQSDDNHGDINKQTVCESMHFRRFCTYSQNMIFSESYFKFLILFTDTHHMDFYYNWVYISHLRKFYVPTRYTRSFVSILSQLIQLLHKVVIIMATEMNRLYAKV